MGEPEERTRELFNVISDELLGKISFETTGSVIRFLVGSDVRRVCRIVDIRGAGAVSVMEEDRKMKVDATLETSHEIFALLCDGKLKPELAFMTGRLNVTGDLVRVMRLGPHLFNIFRQRHQRSRSPRELTEDKSATMKKTVDRLQQDHHLGGSSRGKNVVKGKMPRKSIATPAARL